MKAKSLPWHHSRIYTCTALAFAGLAISLTSLTKASAQPLTAKDILQQFNAVVTNNFSTEADVEGRLVAGNIQNTASSTFFLNPNRGGISFPSDFQAINALTITSCPNCNVNNGGNVNWVNSLGTNVHFDFNGGGSMMQNNPAFTMSQFTVPLNELETDLLKLTPNSAATLSGDTLTFHGTSVNDLAVFNVPVEDLMKAVDIEVTGLSSADTIIVNVTGPAGYAFSEPGHFNEPFSGFEDKTIWNFSGASSLSVTQWQGSILAGSATVTNSSPIQGFLYAENFQGGGELHSFPFNGTIPAPVGVIPEPSTWAMLALGVLGLALVGWRRAACEGAALP